jgi:hypothetical protein
MCGVRRSRSENLEEVAHVLSWAEARPLSDIGQPRQLSGQLELPCGVIKFHLEGILLRLLARHRSSLLVIAIDRETPGSFNYSRAIVSMTMNMMFFVLGREDEHQCNTIPTDAFSSGLPSQYP